MSTELIKALLEAGVHFGHKTSNWNPKMAKFIFGKKANIYIIDLEKTVECLNRASDFLKEIASKGGNILFVGTKKQAQEIVKEEATRCSSPYVNERWIGGLLTNFSTIRKSIERLKDLEDKVEKGILNNLSKKESSKLNKELIRLKKNFSGLKEMQDLPKVIFVIDPKREQTAIREARRLSIPLVALIDTNSDPDTVDFPIPGNDDAIKSIRFITKMIADSVLEGRQMFLSYLKEKPEIKIEKPLVSEEKVEIQPEIIEEMIGEDRDYHLKPKVKQKKVKEE